MSLNSCDSVQTRVKQVRKIGTTRRSVSGVYAFRGETAIQFESTLERDFLIRYEFFYRVLDIVPQPVQIPFVAANGRHYTYTPDFLVYFRMMDESPSDYPKPLLVEVKPEKEWRQHWREWLPKWKAARRYAIEQGWEFRIFDESRIRDQMLENIRFLERYKRMILPEVESREVLASVAEMGSTSLDYLVARHFMGIYQATGIAHIWHLLATQQLACAMDVPLTNGTMFWIPDYGK